jgi:AcrR family transcriptional regulator
VPADIGLTYHQVKREHLAMSSDVAPRTYRMTARADQVARTRSALLAAARDHVSRRPFDQVSLREVARDAGVSTQTLHAHFRHKDDLLEAVTTSFADEFSVELLAQRGRPRTPSGVARTVVQQYERTGEANLRLLALEDRSPSVAALLRRGRREHLTWLEDCLGDRLPPAGPVRRRGLTALYAGTDVGTWKLLRRDLGRSQAGTVSAMALLVSAVVDRGPAPAR